jgi:type IV pilus assembly protein PilE
MISMMERLMPFNRLPRRRSSRGFTLIEMMITVAIIAILGSVAYPAYRDQIAKGKRADAKTQMLAAQQWMERLYSESYTYQKDSAGTLVATLLAAQPFAKSPREGGAAYNITVASTTANDYTLTATRTGTMTGDACGNFTLDNTGNKSVVSFSSSKYASATDAALACWK